MQDIVPPTNPNAGDNPAPANGSPTPAPGTEPAVQQPVTTSTPADVPVADEPQPSVTNQQPVEPTASTAPSKGKKLAVGLLLLLVLAGAGAALYYRVHHKTKAVAVNHDIPSLSYGMFGTQVGQAYPLAQNTGQGIEVNAQLFEGLVRYDSQTKIVPLLATGWTNPDETHWVFTLRQGVKFHDGSPLTADAVKSSLDYAVAHQGDQDGSLMVSLASTIKSVAANGNKVTITTDGPDPTLLNRLADLYVYNPKATVGDADAGTGPYTLQSGTKLSDASTTADLVAVNDYWGGHVSTRALHFTTVTDGDKLAVQAAQGKLDIAGQFTPEQLAAAQAKQTITVNGLTTSFIGINTLNTASPLHSLPGRQAVQSALNVPMIIKAADFQGQATQSSQLVPSSIPGYDPSIKPASFDLAKAKQLLSTVPQAKAPLVFAYPQADQAIATEITNELTAAGFTVKAQSEPSLGALVGAALGGKVDLFYLSYTSDTLDGLDVLSTILVGNKDYNSTTVNDLAKQASVTLDPKTRIGLLQKIAQQVSADVPDVPLYTRNAVYVQQKPYHITTDMPNSQLGAYFWKVHQ